MLCGCFQTPTPALCEAGPGQVGGGAPEQRRGVQRWWRRWRAMLQESAVLSAVLDRTMFRFHRSTTWLDQAQRKAPRRPVRVKVRKQRQREDRSVERKQRGEAEAGGGPRRAGLVPAVGFHGSTSETGAPWPVARPGADTGGKEENGWATAGHSYSGVSGQNGSFLRALQKSGVCGHVTGLSRASKPHPITPSDLTRHQTQQKHLLLALQPRAHPCSRWFHTLCSPSPFNRQATIPSGLANLQ